MDNEGLTDRISYTRKNIFSKKTSNRSFSKSKILRCNLTCVRIIFLIYANEFIIRCRNRLMIEVILRLLKYWTSEHAKRSKTTGTGRMRFLKVVRRRFRNGFREVTQAKPRKSVQTKHNPYEY
uniref:Uncharacterized protein n=1 Tax=Glossina austeni TaxID=7395 RepID=A0A1A9V756_GLOAU